MAKRPATTVPKAMRVQLGRLFGDQSREACRTQRTASEWRTTLRKVLHELDRYVDANVDTDQLHNLIISSGLYAADEALKQDDFWPGYAEGLTRVILALLGDYPDHRRRRGGAKAAGHYSLGTLRQVQYAQTIEQRFRTLLAAGSVGVPGLSTPPREVLNEFRRRFGFKQTHAHFVRWYKKNFPAEYTAVFS
jgi:hypothetical protein